MSVTMESRNEAELLRSHIVHRVVLLLLTEKIFEIIVEKSLSGGVVESNNTIIWRYYGGNAKQGVTKF